MGLLSRLMVLRSGHKRRRSGSAKVYLRGNCPIAHRSPEGISQR